MEMPRQSALDAALWHGQDLVNELVRIGIQRSQDVQQLNHIQAAQTCLVLRDKSLRPTQPISQVLLQPVALPAQLDEQRGDVLVTGVQGGSGHSKNSRRA